MEHWDEIRTAYHVARMGTVSGAADVLGVHHATVIRHIDALEGRLGAKLFQRHARGYTPTEAGEDLLKVAQTTDDQFTQLAGRIRGRGTEVTGEVVVTTLSIFSQRVTPVLIAFQEEHPEISIQMITGERVFRLEYGEAHVAIRAGSKPDQPDNVVQPFFHETIGLYASRDYVERFGPLVWGEWENHRFVAGMPDASRSPQGLWMKENIPDRLIRYRASHLTPMQHAVRAGAGIGFVPRFDVQDDDELVEMAPPLRTWAAPVWIVTHVDLHRTAKVQTLVHFLRNKAKEWPDQGI